MLGPHTVLALLFIVVALEVAALQIYMQIDSVVNVDLYRFGLQFNYIWALEYWNCYRFATFCLFGASALMGFTLVPYLQQGEHHSLKVELHTVSFDFCRVCGDFVVSDSASRLYR